MYNTGGGGSQPLRRILTSSQQHPSSSITKDRLGDDEASLEASLKLSASASSPAARSGPSHCCRTNSCSSGVATCTTIDLANRRCRCGSLTSAPGSNEHPAACMIIDHRWPPLSPRDSTHRDRLLLLLLKHRTAKFSRCAFNLLTTALL